MTPICFITTSSLHLCHVCVLQAHWWAILLVILTLSGVMGCTVCICSRTLDTSGVEWPHSCPLWETSSGGTWIYLNLHYSDIQTSRLHWEVLLWPAQPLSRCFINWHLPTSAGVPRLLTCFEKHHCRCQLSQPPQRVHIRKHTQCSDLKLSVSDDCVYLLLRRQLSLTVRILLQESETSRSQGLPGYGLWNKCCTGIYKSQGWWFGSQFLLATIRHWYLLISAIIIFIISACE